MEYVQLFARAKINLAIDVLEKLDNHYHNLKMIMQSISLYDSILIQKTNLNKITLKTNLNWLPTDNKNIVIKTANLLKKEFDIKEGLNITLIKNTPVSAGLGGGSSDCAATLIGIRNLFKLKLSDQDLLSLGTKLGADVPFCLKRGTALACGIGEKLTLLPPFPKCFIVIVKPSINISTASVFNSLDLKKIKARPDIEKIIYYINKKDLKNICLNMCNVLETVTMINNPIIEKIKKIMLSNNALGSLMSGSGSAVFGIWESKQDAIKTLKKLKYKYNFNECFLTKPFNNYLKKY